MFLKSEFSIVRMFAVAGIAVALLAAAGIRHSEANAANYSGNIEPVNAQPLELYPTKETSFSENRVIQTAAADTEIDDTEKFVQSKPSAKKNVSKLRKFILFFERSLTSAPNREPHVSPKQGVHDSLGHDNAKRLKRFVKPFSVPEQFLFEEPDFSVQASAISLELEIPVEESISLWQELRDGFQLEEFNNSAVRKYEKWYSSKPHYLSRLFSKAATNLPYVLEQVQRQNLPTEIALLPIIESAYNPYAYSDAGAVGLWQFMPYTGLRYGLNRDYWYEGRRDIIRSTSAALDYLKALHSEFNGDWALALAAYNAGENRIQREVSRNRSLNRSTKYSALQLPKETKKYLPKLIAIKNIINDPNKFGVVLPDLTTESTFAIVDFDYQVDLNKVAVVTESNYDEFAHFNPGLRRGMTPPKGPHRILVPIAQYDRILAWKLNIDPAQALGRASSYTIQPGDTLSQIAAVNGITVESIKSYNQITSDLIIAGQVLRLPLIGPFGTYANLDQTSAPSRIHKVKRGDSLNRIASLYDVSVDQLRKANQLSSNLIRIGQTLHLPTPKVQEKPSQTASENQTRLVHRVRTGESLWSISKLYDVDVRKLQQWNKIKNNSLILPNQRIVVRTK